MCTINQHIRNDHTHAGKEGSCWETTKAYSQPTINSLGDAYGIKSIEKTTRIAMDSLSGLDKFWSGILEQQQKLTVKPMAQTSTAEWAGGDGAHL